MIDVHRTTAAALKSDRAKSASSSSKKQQAEEELKSSNRSATDLAPVTNPEFIPLPTSKKKPDSSFLASLKQKITQHQKQILDKCAATGEAKQ